MIHPIPSSLVFLILVTNDLLHFIVFHLLSWFILNHVIISVHIQNLIQASCSLMALSSPSVHLFSHLLIAPLGDLQTLAPFLPVQILWPIILLTPLSCPSVAFCHLYNPEIHFLCTCYIQADVQGKSHNSIIINSCLVTTSGLPLVLSSSITFLCSGRSTI